MKNITKHLFPILCGTGIIMCFIIGGIVIGGILMGIISTIAIWMSIQRFPMWMRKLMCKNKMTIVISDLVFLKLTATILMLLGGGVTIVVAVMTQMVLLGILIDNMKDQIEIDHGSFLTLEPCR